MGELPHPADSLLDKPYAALLDPTAQWFVIFANANIGYRCGPFPGPKIGELLDKANAAGCPMSLALWSPEVDWEFALDLCGGPEKLLEGKANREAEKTKEDV